MTRTFVYVGGWDWAAESYPLRSFELDTQSGALSERGDPVDLGPNPSFLTISADGRWLFAANERSPPQGGVTSASIDPNNGALTKLDHQPAVGDGFVYVQLSPKNDFLLAASYGGANVSVFPIGADGSLGAVRDTEFYGAGAQTHSVVLDRTARFAFVPNKGADTIGQLRFSAASGLLTPNAVPSFADEPGSGPRHAALRADGKVLYVMHENDSSLAALAVDSNGRLSPLTRQSTLPPGTNAANTGAHVLLSADERFVYASNRGHDSIAVFSTDAQGALERLENEPSRGATPRHFAIDASGRWLVVANQDAGNLAVFRIETNGLLSPVGEPVTGLQQPNAVAVLTRR